MWNINKHGVEHQGEIPGLGAVGLLESHSTTFKKQKQNKSVVWSYKARWPLPLQTIFLGSHKQSPGASPCFRLVWRLPEAAPSSRLPSCHSLAQTKFQVGETSSQSCWWVSLKDGKAERMGYNKKTSAALSRDLDVRVRPPCSPPSQSLGVVGSQVKAQGASCMVPPAALKRWCF